MQSFFMRVNIWLVIPAVLFVLEECLLRTHLCLRIFRNGGDRHQIVLDGSNLTSLSEPLGVIVNDLDNLLLEGRSLRLELGG